MRTKLLSPSEVERIVHRPDLSRQQPGEAIVICTIVDIVETAENARKARGTMNLTRFLQGWRTLHQPGGALFNGEVLVAALDHNRLRDALFERDEAGKVLRLWEEAMDAGLPPDRTARRLILRPSTQQWWGDELYLEMESWYCGTAQADD